MGGLVTLLSRDRRPTAGISLAVPSHGMQIRAHHFFTASWLLAGRTLACDATWVDGTADGLLVILPRRAAMRGETPSRGTGYEYDAAV